MFDNSIENGENNHDNLTGDTFRDALVWLDISRQIEPSEGLSALVDEPGISKVSKIFIEKFAILKLIFLSNIFDKF